MATIGYCSGGRQSFLAACSLDLDAAVDCYGAFVVAPPPEGAPAQGRVPSSIWPRTCRARSLGLFGADDQYPSPEEVGELEKALTEAGKEFDFHIFEGAGHAFFSVDRPGYRPEAAVEGWQAIWDFFGRHLATD